MEWPDWMPENLQVSAEGNGLSSVRQIESAAGIHHGALQKIFTGGASPTIATVLAILRALGYKCDNKEFLIVNEIASAKQLKPRSLKATLSESGKTEKSYLSNLCFLLLKAS